MTQQLKKQQVLQIVITQSLLYPSEINTRLCNYNVPLLSFLTTMFQLFSAFYLMETTSCSIIPFTSDFQHSNTFISFPVKVKVAQSCPTLCNPMDYTVHGIPGQNTGVGGLSLLQGIFPTQGSNPSLPLCRQILYQLSHKGSLRILEQVAYPFSSRSSRPRN